MNNHQVMKKYVTGVVERKKFFRKGYDHCCKIRPADIISYNY
jgi:hypothetical protein